MSNVWLFINVPTYRRNFEDGYFLAAAISFGMFLFTAFYLWKNNFFKRND